MLIFIQIMSASQNIRQTTQDLGIMKQIHMQNDYIYV